MDKILEGWNVGKSDTPALHCLSVAPHRDSNYGREGRRGVASAVLASALTMEGTSRLSRLRCGTKRGLHGLHLGTSNPSA
jgi:hypothetical protein